MILRCSFETLVKQSRYGADFHPFYHFTAVCPNIFGALSTPHVYKRHLMTYVKLFQRKSEERKPALRKKQNEFLQIKPGFQTFVLLAYFKLFKKNKLEIVLVRLSSKIIFYIY
jgi:hypothetical protein